MKRIICLMFMGLLIPLMAAAQDVTANASDNASSFSFGPHFGFHFFSCDDVNQYIDDDLSEYSVEGGSTDMFLAFDLGIDLKKMMTENLAIKFGVDGLISPKFVSTSDGESFTYVFKAVSLSATGLVFIPISTNVSFLIGAGPDYYFTWFEDYAGSGFGGRVQLGIKTKYDFEASLIGRYAKIENDKNINGATPDFEMDFSGVEINCVKYF